MRDIVLKITFIGFTKCILYTHMYMYKGISMYYTVCTNDIALLHYRLYPSLTFRRVKPVFFMTLEFNACNIHAYIPIILIGRYNVRGSRYL